MALILFSKGIHPALPLKHDTKTLMRKYARVHKEFSRKLCPSGTEETFWEKYRDYIKGEFFIPVLPKNILDKQTIAKFLPKIKKKAQWIKDESEKLKKVQSFDPIFVKIKSMEKDIEELLTYKENYDVKIKKGREKISAQHMSERKLIQFSNNLKTFLESLSFLQNYEFPVDHFDLRMNYETFKKRDDVEGKRKANDLFFYRKIVQDGTTDDKGKKSDRYLRALIDTLYIGIDREKDFLSENFRYDFSDFIRSLKHHLKTHGPLGIRRRLRTWQQKIEKKVNFFTSISQRPLQKKLDAEYSLKKFVLNKLAETYHFWSKRDESLKALFVLETILFNEVGRLEDKGALERRDIAQVVVNRLGLKRYNSFEQDDPLKIKLTELKFAIPLKDHWLNVMFKEGEFSFTYFFIMGNVRIYCPDQTSSGNRLRDENIRIALDVLQKPRPSFKALRYFSRASMLGRVDMEQIWKKEGYIPLPERPGPRVYDKKLIDSYKTKHYRYLYQFQDPVGKTFQTLLIDKALWVRPLEKIEFYHYRNPHFFRYFLKE